VKLILAEDNRQVVASIDVDIAAIHRVVKRRRLRSGDIRAAWTLIEGAAEATSTMQNEIITAVIRYGSPKSKGGKEVKHGSSPNGEEKS